MRAELTLLWLLTGGLYATTASLYAAPRDPFQPAADQHCLTPPDALAGWRLQGVLGRPPTLYAWLVSPQNAVVKIAAAQPLSLTGWQLIAIAPRSLTLAARDGCSSHIKIFSLKGSAYAQESTLAADMPQPHTGAGQ